MRTRPAIISDSAALGILRRAATLDTAATPTGLARHMLQQAALDAGISAGAIERALGEYDDEQRHRAGVRRWMRKLAGAVAIGAGLFAILMVGMALYFGTTVPEVLRLLFDL